MAVNCSSLVKRKSRKTTTQTDRSSEIIYLFINIGFKGQYREGGAEQLKAFVHQLEQTISQYRTASGVHYARR